MGAFCPIVHEAPYFVKISFNFLIIKGSSFDEDLCAMFLLLRVNTEILLERGIGRLPVLNLSQCSLQRSLLVASTGLSLGVREGKTLMKA